MNAHLLWPLIEIPDDCLSCRFFSESEDGDCFCAVYNKSWEYDDDGSYTGKKFNEGDKPEFCKATHVQVIEPTPEAT